MKYKLVTRMKQMGGSRLNNPRREFSLYNELNTFIMRNPILYSQILPLQPTTPTIQQPFISRILNGIETDEYNKIFRTLITKFLDKSKYTQVFRDADDRVIQSMQVEPTNHNVMSIIMLSFLIETELFMLLDKLEQYRFNTTKQYNKGDPSDPAPSEEDIKFKNYKRLNFAQIKNTNMYSIFSGKHMRADNDNIPIEEKSIFDVYRIYDPALIGKNWASNDGSPSIYSDFCNKMDAYVDEFMWILVNKLRNYIYASFDLNIYPDDIYSCFVPLESKDHDISTPHKFDFIFADWRDKIYTFMLIEKPDTNKVKLMNTINICITNSLEQISDTELRYTAEGTGYFSFIYMLNNLYTDHIKFGSCITYTLFEMYILAMLHIKGDNIGMVLESKHTNDEPHDPSILHDIWLSTQQLINTPEINFISFNVPLKIITKSITHWASAFNLSDDTFTDPTRHLIRTVFPVGRRILTFDVDRKNILRASIYPILDSYRKFISSNINRDTKSPDQTRINDLMCYRKIMEHIHKRIILLEEIINSTPYDSSSPEIPLLIRCIDAPPTEEQEDIKQKKQLKDTFNKIKSFERSATGNRSELPPRQKLNLLNLLRTNIKHLNSTQTTILNELEQVKHSLISNIDNFNMNTLTQLSADVINLRKKKEKVSLSVLNSIFTQLKKVIIHDGTLDDDQIKIFIEALNYYPIKKMDILFNEYKFDLIIISELWVNIMKQIIINSMMTPNISYIIEHICNLLDPNSKIQLLNFIINSVVNMNDVIHYIISTIMRTIDNAVLVPILIKLNDLERLGLMNETQHRFKEILLHEKRGIETLIVI
jgi:hypothetical protein